MSDLFRYKAYYKFDTIDNLTRRLDDNIRVSLIDSDSGLFISCSVFSLRHDLWCLLRLEVQVYEERPYTFYF